jgi:hypothetical protein
MNESEKQFSFSRAALSTCGRAKKQIPISQMGYVVRVATGADYADPHV